MSSIIKFKNPHAKRFYRKLETYRGGKQAWVLKVETDLSLYPKDEGVDELFAEMQQKVAENPDKYDRAVLEEI